MLKLFRNKVRDSQSATTKITEGLNRKVIEYKIRCAEGLAKKTQSWSVRKWKVALILFCIVSAGISSFVIIDSLTGSAVGYNYTVLPFIVPKYSTKPDGPVKSHNNTISEREYNQLRQFDRYIDSLSKSEAGKSTYDSIVKYRSGLLDSIHFIEQMYLSQRK